MISLSLGVGSSAPVYPVGIRTISWKVPGALDGYASSCGFIGWRMRRTRIILTTVTRPLALSSPFAHHPHDSYASSCSFHHLDWLSLVGVRRIIPGSPGWSPPWVTPGVSLSWMRFENAKVGCCLCMNGKNGLKHPLSIGIGVIGMCLCCQIRLSIIKDILYDFLVSFLQW